MGKKHKFTTTNNLHKLSQTILCRTGVLGGSANCAENGHAVPFKASCFIVWPQRLSEQVRERRTQFFIIVSKDFLVLLLIRCDQFTVNLQSRIANLEEFSKINK